MLLIDANAPDDRQAQILGDVQGMIEADGTLVASHDWGDRRMTFEIDHRPDAHYHLFQFESGNELLERLQHQLKIMDGLMRFRIIRLKPGAPTPPPPRDSLPRDRRDEREPEGRVAARAAADAPAQGEEAPVQVAEAPAEVAEAPPEAPAPPAEVPPAEAPPAEPE